MFSSLIMPVFKEVRDSLPNLVNGNVWCAHARAPRTLSAIAPKKNSKVYDLELWSGIHCGYISVWYCCKGITSISRWKQSLDCIRWGVFLARLLPPIRRPLLLCWQVAKCSVLVHLLVEKWCRCTHRPFPAFSVPWAGPGTKSRDFLYIFLGYLVDNRHKGSGRIAHFYNLHSR